MGGKIQFPVIYILLYSTEGVSILLNPLWNDVIGINTEQDI